MPPHYVPEVTIRATEAGDLPAIYSVLGEVVPWMPKSEEWADIATEFLSQVHVCSFVSVVRKLRLDAGQVVGFASISFETKVRGGVIGHIEDVVVDAIHRRGGVGRMLVEALLEESRRRNAYRVYLECSESNVGFYRSCDFERSGVSMCWGSRQ